MINSLDNKSRVKGDLYARFCENLGLKCPGLLDEEGILKGKYDQMQRTLKRLILGSIVLSCFYACYVSRQIIAESKFEASELGSFVEKDFPYITVPLVANDLGAGFPDSNVTARGLAIQLGNGSYACFDTDLLRWSAAWTGDFLPMVLPAQVSYHDFFKKNNNELPHIPGSPKIATGMYAGWSTGQPNFRDVRPWEQNTEGLYWGPVPPQVGEWKGVYVHGGSVVLSYTVGGAEIIEVPGSETFQGEVAFVRTFRVGKSDRKLYLNVAEVGNGSRSESKGTTGYIYQGAARDSMTAVAVKGGMGTVKVYSDRYLVVELPESAMEREFTVVSWKGAAVEPERFSALLNNSVKGIPDYGKGGPARWGEPVLTRGILTPDTAAFVTDQLTLPVPNHWRRNIRVADIGFFANGDAAVSTYEGDVWIVEGINKSLNRLKWRRFASGFYEPMSIEIYKDQVYVYAKEGIVRLHDLNGDGEADYYENFCNLMQQSTGTREWAADMVADHNGNFYVAKGGHVTGMKGVLPFQSNLKKWRASSRQSGSIVKILPDGKTAEVLATGLRMPYLGLNREKGILTASDQQGNYVPETPIYVVKKGDYFGVPVTLHREDEPEITPPITWIPHHVERSAASQAWVSSDKMGPLSRQMLHFSFGRPGIFRVLLDSSAQTIQGGVAFLQAGYPAPVLKGETHPGDGQMYIAGFNNYASNSRGISALLRLRYTGKPSYMVSGLRSGDKGIILSFDSKLDAVSVSSGSFRVKRWNYQRTEAYGSGHYKLDGSRGEEPLYVQAAHLSTDGKRVLLLIPGMDKAEQVEILYRLRAMDGKIMNDAIWLTINELSDLDTRGFSLKESDLVLKAGTGMPVESDAQAASVQKGQELFRQLACIGCHSPETVTEGMYGPPFKGIFGSRRELADGTSVSADEGYLIESILDPAKKVVRGYNAEMPSFEGILSEQDIESLMLYIKSL